MTNISRFESLLPELADSFRHANPLRQRLAVLEACVLVASRVGLEGSEVNAAIEILRCPRDEWIAVRDQMKILADRFENEYSDCGGRDDAPSKEAALIAFSKARAASAFVFALSEDDGHFQEAMYEALSALEDPHEIVGAVEKILH